MTEGIAKLYIRPWKYFSLDFVGAWINPSIPKRNYLRLPQKNLSESKICFYHQTTYINRSKLALKSIKNTWKLGNHKKKQYDDRPTKN